MADYTELLCSLPHLRDPFRQRPSGLSPVQLQKRLNMLLPDDQQRMNQLWHTVLWSGIPLDMGDPALVRQYERTMALIDDPQLHEWLQWRMDFRTLVAALRRRHLGQDAPADTRLWACGPIGKLLVQRWNQPSFGLADAHPWLPQAEHLLQQHESLALERLLLQNLWHYLSRCEPINPRSFAAVVLYIARWDICQRLRHYDHQAGLERFQALIDASLAAHGIAPATTNSKSTDTGSLHS